MKISVFGLGYVGCVSLGCLAQNGHKVLGVDISSIKVDLINQGKPTIIESEIDTIIEEQRSKENIKATKDYKDAVLNSELSIICVGTPSTPEGHLNLDYVFKTARQIGEALQTKSQFHTVAIRSTVLPGTNFKVGEIIESVSKKKRNKDFAVVSNPEFLREGTAVMDYFNPPVTVVGSDNETAIHLMKEVYSKVNGSFELVDIKVAEIIKYVNNSYHALKVVFANEIGNICKKLNIDSHEVMRLFCMDTQLNISPYYFKPGFAYGGSCLPKDLQALKTLTHDHYLLTPVINSISISNEHQKEIALDLVLKLGVKKIGILGLSFKPGTDDLRHSPIVDIIEKLVGKGYNIKIFDPNIKLQRLIGKNKSYIVEKLPHINSLFCDNLEETIDWSEAIILTNKEEFIKNINISMDKTIIDLAHYPSLRNYKDYHGLCW
jgi:GDP-mannose 6-dehydrogenase